MSGDVVAAASLAAAKAARYHAAHQRGEALAELCRLQISRVPCLIMAVAAVAAGASAVTVIAGLALIVATCSIGAALNDWADIESDRVNERHERPLVSGVLTRSDVVLVVGLAAVAAAIAELLLPQPTGLAVAAAAALIGWGSASRPLALQRRGFLGLVVLAGAYLVLPICLAVGFEALARIAPLALLGAGALAHKDVRDEVGDRAAGKRTLLVQVGYGPMAWVAVAAAVLGVAGLAITLPPGWWCVPALVAIAGLVTLAVDGHRPRIWLVVRVATIFVAVLAGISAATI